MGFRIIWVDDSRKWVDSIKDEISDVVKETGLHPVIEYFENIAFAKNKISENYVDLILVDCNLPGAKNGDDFVLDLRNNRCMSLVLFYSQDANNLQKLKANSSLYLSDKEDFVSKVEEIAIHCYRKYNHPAFMRGLLLSEFIDLENLMEDLIAACFDDKAQYFREKLFDAGGSFTFMEKTKFISRLIKKCPAESEIHQTVQELNFTSNKFNKCIIEKRNILAHAYPVFDRTNGKFELQSYIGNVELNPEWFAGVRTDISSYKSIFKRLTSLGLK